MSYKPEEAMMIKLDYELPEYPAFDWIVAQSGTTNPATSGRTPILTVCASVTGIVAADDCVPRRCV